MSYTIKHMGIGGILDQAIAIVKDNFMLLFTIMLFGYIPVMLVQGFLQLAVTPELPPNPTIQDRMRVQQEVSAYLPWFMGFNVFCFLIVLPITNAAIIQSIARVYLGQTITAVEALKHGASRFFPLIWTTILMYLAIMGGLFLFIIPGIYFAIWFGLSQHVVVIEGLSGTKALGRSKKLVHKDRGKFLALGLIAGVISFAIAMIAQMIPQPHVVVLASVFAQAVTTMIWAAAFVVFYFSCRCNVENFDLHYLAESIGAQPAEVGAAPAMARGTI
jgi:hypothetical protein